jgi:hypothetical protein
MLISLLIPVPLEDKGLMWLLLLPCTYVLLLVFQMLLKTWVQSTFLYWVKKDTALWTSPQPGQWLLPSFFLSFLLILVVGIPQHEK